MDGGKYLYGGSIAFFIASLFNAILVIMKETDESIYEWLKNTFGHHWIGHGILTLLIFFIILGLTHIGMKEVDISDKYSLINILLVAGVFLSFILILGFFLI